MESKELLFYIFCAALFLAGYGFRSIMWLIKKIVRDAVRAHMIKKKIIEMKIPKKLWEQPEEK